MWLIDLASTEIKCHAADPFCCQAIGWPVRVVPRISHPGINLSCKDLQKSLSPLSLSLSLYLSLSLSLSLLLSPVCSTFLSLLSTTKQSFEGKEADIALTHI